MSCYTQFTVTSLLLLINLGSNGTASAKDARLEIIKCQQYSQPEERLECFDQARLLLIEEMNLEKASDASIGMARDSEGSAPTATQPKVPPSITDVVLSVKDVDGKPRFVLANGQVWQSIDKRRLSFQGGGKDTAKIDKTPVGFLLHFNNSFFALLVSRVN